jgi:hypothetical protein
MSTVLPPGLNCRNFRARGPGSSTRVGATLGMRCRLRGTAPFCLFGTHRHRLVVENGNEASNFTCASGGTPVPTDKL